MDTESSKSWTIMQRQSFRFFSLYLLFFMYTGFFHFMWDPMIQKAGQWLHVWKDITTYPNGSGDTTYNYLQVLVMLIATFIISIIWWAFDHKRKSYNTALYWVTAFLRYILAFYMLTYGFAKVFQTQFPFPSFSTLIKPYGDATPMNLAWTFMGYSTAFNYFTGFAEVIGGCLLFFRRTTMFGCLFSMTVLTNVVVMNFCYDIPVKIFSTHLLLLTVFICAPYMPSLYRFFFQRKAINERKTISVYNTDSQKKLHIICKAFIICVFMLIQLNRLSYGDEMYAKPPLYGLYEVDNYVIGNDTLQPLVTDKYRWRYMAIDWKERAYIQTMNGEGLYCKCNIDTVAKKITLKKDSLNYSFLYKAAGNQLQLDGNNQHKKLLIDMHRKDVTDFRLVKTGFNWVNEYPNNR